MRMIHAEQAIFASSDRGRMKGYQVVAMSPGIDRGMVQEISRWAPTKLPSNDCKAWTVNYFPLSHETVAITRTVLGGPEYSGRGGIQVVTSILVLTNDQFIAYGCNAIALVESAMAMGYLRLPLHPEREVLEPAILPSRAIIESPMRGNEQEEDEDQELLDQVTALIQSTRRVAIIGLSDPVQSISHLVPRLSMEARRSLSFTTGLSPAVRRPFQLHCLPTADRTQQRVFEAQNIVRVDSHLEN